LGKIIQLDAHVADLIAAGEVVERPASVIKELMENAIDAGADKITVEIKGGGMTYMRVTDNGGGIADEDTETAFLRHATSKLRDEKGLEAISTLGFRGEALAAIAAVARIELLTRVTGASEGTSLSIEGGNIRAKTAAGCPEGTTMIVRDLFYNTPARLKFMKSDKAEGAAVSAQVIHVALSHPEVSVRYIKDGKEECHTPGDGRMDSCIYSLFGRDFMNGMLKAETSDDEVSVTGFVSTPDAARGNRSSQFFFVNGRAVKSKTLQAALEQAYRNMLFTGRFPSCVLYISLKPSDVDVNVHPTKTEVKFVREHQVFDGVYYGALSALEKRKMQPADKPPIQASLPTERVNPTAMSGPAAVTSLPKSTPASEPGLAAHIRTGPTAAEQFRSTRTDTYGGGSVSHTFAGRVPVVSENRTYVPVKNDIRVPYQTSANAATPVTATSVAAADAVSATESATEAPEQISIDKSPAADKPSYRIIGEALDTYILVEHSGSLWLIDKHAAHERVHFDRLKRERQEIMSQTLLQPVISSLGQEDTALLLEHESVFRRLGLLLEPFGEDAVAVRQTPADIEASDVDTILGEAAQLLRQGGRPDDGFLYDELLHSIACKAAIKAGKSSSLPEMEALVDKVLSGEVQYCPHGRPVAVEMSKSSLDKSFKRI
jgi:DNA mismatch repair protein MutL